MFFSPPPEPLPFLDQNIGMLVVMSVCCAPSSAPEHLEACVPRSRAKRLSLMQDLDAAAETDRQSYLSWIHDALFGRMGAAEEDGSQDHRITYSCKGTCTCLVLIHTNLIQQVPDINYASRPSVPLWKTDPMDNRLEPFD